MSDLGVGRGGLVLFCKKLSDTGLLKVPVWQQLGWEERSGLPHPSCPTSRAVGGCPTLPLPPVSSAQMRPWWSQHAPAPR